MKYADYKAVIKIEDKNGNSVSELTTFREDTITNITKATLCPFDDTVEEEMTITIRPNHVMMWAGKDVKYARPDFLSGEKGVPTVPTTKE